MNIIKRLGDFFVPGARNNYTPHAIGHRSLSVYAGLMVSVKLLTLFSLDLMPQNKAFSSSVTPSNILELTNYSREAYKLPALEMNGLLSQAAQAKAEDMLKNQYFSHNSPDGKTPWDFIKGAGYNYLEAGENLAINFYDSNSLENAWMNSPEHKANILNSGFTDIGIGVVQGEYKGSKAIFVVQMFGTSAQQFITPQLAYSHPKPLTYIPEVSVPVPSRISLAAPVLAGADYALVRSAQYAVHGYAPGADSVYVIVNNKPQVKLDVIDGEYKGDITLSEGANKVSAISFSGVSIASPIAKNISVQLDSTAPTVSAAINPVVQNGQKEFVIEVHGQNDVAKVIARVGGETMLLQPASQPGVWQGRVNADISQIQGGINVQAYDLAGNYQNDVIGSFSGSVLSSYGFLAQKNYVVSILGKALPLQSVNNLYIYITLFLLTLLAIAIGIKRNVQHLGIIAHASAMVAVALVLWIT